MNSYNSNNWDNLMLKSLNGDKISYNKLLTEISIWLKFYFRKRIEPQFVEDLIQETLLSIHDKRQTFDKKQKFGPWLNAIAKHKLIDFLRKEYKYEKLEFCEEIHVPREMEEENIDYDLDNLLAILSKESAEILKMAKITGLSLDEIAKKTNKSTANIKVIIHRSIKKLQELAVG